MYNTRSELYKSFLVAGRIGSRGIRLPHGPRVDRPNGKTGSYKIGTADDGTWDDGKWDDGTTEFMHTECSTLMSRMMRQMIAHDLRQRRLVINKMIDAERKRRAGDANAFSADTGKLW